MVRAVVADVEGVGVGLDLFGDGRVAPEEVGDLLLAGVLAERVDGADGLPAEVLREEETGMMTLRMTRMRARAAQVEGCLILVASQS